MTDILTSTKCLRPEDFQLHTSDLRLTKIQTERSQLVCLKYLRVILVESFAKLGIPSFERNGATVVEQRFVLVLRRYEVNDFR